MSYTKPSISGYNASPPPDDGSQVTANAIKWSNHVTKLGDPLKSYADAINNATESAFNDEYGKSIYVTDPPYNAAVGGQDITTALTSAMAAGKTIRFKDGTFGIDSNITITDTQVWIGAGRDKTTIQGITGNEQIAINGGSLIVIGIKFDNLGQLFYNTGSIVELNVQDCWINDVLGIANVDDAANTMERLTFIGNRVTSCANGIYVQTNTLGSAEVAYNNITGISSGQVAVAGIRLGADYNEGLAVDANRQHFRVIGNVVDGVDTTSVSSSARAWGIIVFGEYHEVLGNTVKSITTSGRGLGAEGIYSKGRHVVLSNNVCVDAVEGVQGMITIKGDRGEVSSTPGFAKICTGNTCWRSSSGSAGHGIWVQSDDTIVANNYLEGMATNSAAGITEAGGIGVSDTEKSNVILQGNVIRDISGNYGILAMMQGQNLKILDNIIDEISDAEAGSTTRAIAITGQTGTLDGIEIRGNRIRISTTDSTATLTGIYFAQGQANSNITIDGNQIKLADATATEVGIQFAGTTAPADNVTITNNDLSQCGAAFSSVIAFEASKAPTNVRIAGNKWPVFQTTGSAATNIAAIALADEHAYMISAQIKGEEETTITDRCMYFVRGLIYRTATGNAAIQGSVNADTAIEVTAGMDGTLAVTGSDTLARVQVTGAASTTMNWTLDLTVN